MRLKQQADEDEIHEHRAEEDEAYLQQKLNIILDEYDDEEKMSWLSSRASR